MSSDEEEANEDSFVELSEFIDLVHEHYSDHDNRGRIEESARDILAENQDCYELGFDRMPDEGGDGEELKILDVIISSGRIGALFFFDAIKASSLPRLLDRILPKAPYLDTIAFCTVEMSPTQAEEIFGRLSRVLCPVGMCIFEMTTVME